MMAKTILAQVEGWTPVIDSVVQDVGATTALVFGKAWRYCQMSDGVCKASQDRLAEELGMSRQTINAHLSKLVEARYLRDLTPELSGLPHQYADTGKAGLSISLTATSQKTLHPPVKNFDTKKEFKKQEKEREHKSPPALDFSSMTVPEARSLPTIKMYTEATEFFPGSPTWEFVHTFITANNLTADKLRTAAQAWAVAGFKQSNVKGILEWARDGVPERYKLAIQSPVQELPKSHQRALDDMTPIPYREYIIGD